MTDDESALPSLLQELQQKAQALGLNESMREKRSYRQMLSQT